MEHAHRPPRVDPSVGVDPAIVYCPKLLRGAWANGATVLALSLNKTLELYDAVPGIWVSFVPSFNR